MKSEMRLGLLILVIPTVGCIELTEQTACSIDANACLEATDAENPIVDSTSGDAPIDSSEVSTDGGDADDTSDPCAGKTCLKAPDSTCADGVTLRTYSATGTCSGGSCSYPSADKPCALGEICRAGACVAQPSCAGGLSCGSVSCCDWKEAPGGAFFLGRGAGAETDACSGSGWASGKCGLDEQPEHLVTISSFRLDTFEVTVGRFRKFVDAYPGSKPAAGAGVHPKIAGTGWDSAWDSKLPATAADLVTAMKACKPTASLTWTDSPGAKENEPIGCVNWYVAFAFCAWDGGRLPTEAEWEYAATGGSENRVLPWGNTAPTPSLASYGCLYNGGSTCEAADVPSVGSTPLGAGRWGHQDLAGSYWEWAFDYNAAYTSATTTDPANLGPGADRANRGGSGFEASDNLRAANRESGDPAGASLQLGFRCAR